MMVRDSPRRVSSFRALAACRTEQRLSRALPSKGTVPINQERVLRMYAIASREIIGIGTTKSPGRILGAFRPNLVEKAAQGVRLKYAFCFTPENRDDVRMLLKHAEVRHIDFQMPVYMHNVDGKEFLMSHPIPDDDSSYRGDDIAIWTNDPAIGDAMSEMSERIWEMGKPAEDMLEEPRPAKRVALTRP